MTREELERAVDDALWDYASPPEVKAVIRLVVEACCVHLPKCVWSEDFGRWLGDQLRTTFLPPEARDGTD